MAVDQYVKPLGNEEVNEEAMAVFQNFIDKKGGVPNWARVMSHRPSILQSFTSLLGVTMGPGLVEQDNKWKCAYIVSKINKCEYCLGVVEGMLKQLGVAEGDIADVISDEKASLKDDEKAAVEYAKAVTENPVEISEEVYTALKEHYNEDQIVELTAAIAIFNYINRFNDALGVLPEGE